MTTAEQNVQNLESELSGEAPEAPPVPEKFKGKSTAEIIQILANTESELGRKNNEVGHLRRLTDEVLGLAKASRDAQQPAKAKITSEDLLADPDKVVTERAKEIADERSLASDQRVAQLEGQLALDRFSRKYPSFEQDLQDPKFQTWVTGTPYRQTLAARAAHGDFNSADELFTAYGEVRPKDDKDETTDDPDLNAARKVGLAKGGGSAVSDTSKGNAGKKIYKREDLIQMRIDNPDGYHERFDREFLPAYREGRVR